MPSLASELASVFVCKCRRTKEYYYKQHKDDHTTFFHSAQCVVVASFLIKQEACSQWFPRRQPIFNAGSLNRKRPLLYKPACSHIIDLRGPAYTNRHTHNLFTHTKLSHWRARNIREIFWWNFLPTSTDKSRSHAHTKLPRLTHARTHIQWMNKISNLANWQTSERRHYRHARNFECVVARSVVCALVPSSGGLHMSKRTTCVIVIIFWFLLRNFHCHVHIFDICVRSSRVLHSLRFSFFQIFGSNIFGVVVFFSTNTSHNHRMHITCNNINLRMCSCTSAPWQRPHSPRIWRGRVEVQRGRCEHAVQLRVLWVHLRERWEWVSEWVSG